MSCILDYGLLACTCLWCLRGTAALGQQQEFIYHPKNNCCEDRERKLSLPTAQLLRAKSGRWGQKPHHIRQDPLKLAAILRVMLVFPLL